MLFAELASASERLAATTKRGEKAALLAATCCGAWRPTRSTWPSASSPARRARDASASDGRRCATSRSAPAAEPSLTVLDVDAARSSGWRRCRAAASTRPGGRCSPTLFARATEAEQQLLWRVLGGELRQGALDGVMVDAVAKAAGVPIAAVRRAHMMSGSLGRDGDVRR